MRRVKHWRPKQRERILSGYTKNGMSITEYCQRQGVPKSTFSTWRKKAQKGKQPAGKGFLKVTTSVIKNAEAVRIETPKGYRIEIPAGTDKNWIQGIIDAVRVQ